MCFFAKVKAKTISFLIIIAMNRTIIQKPLSGIERNLMIRSSEYYDD